MVEELKIIAEVLAGLTSGALYGVMAYLVLEFLKSIIVPSVFVYGAIKIFGMFFNKRRVIAYEDLDTTSHRKTR